MIETDKTHLFNVAGDGLFLILILFSGRKDLKTLHAGNSLSHWRS